MKTLGIAMLMCACVFSGFFLGSAGFARTKNLEAMMLFLSSIRREMLYRRTPLTAILSEACERAELKKLAFLPVCAELFGAGMPFSEAWRTALGEKGSVMLFNPEDIRLLCALGDALGTTDCDGQLSLIDDYSGIFDLRLKQAREDTKKYGRLCKSLGMLAAAGVAVIFI